MSPQYSDSSRVGTPAGAGIGPPRWRLASGSPAACGSAATGARRAATASALWLSVPAPSSVPVVTNDTSKMMPMTVTRKKAATAAASWPGVRIGEWCSLCASLMMSLKQFSNLQGEKARQTRDYRRKARALERKSRGSATVSMDGRLEKLYPSPHFRNSPTRL